MTERKQVPESEILRQQEYMKLVRAMERRPQTYHIVSMGCQMNERDSETIAGMLNEMGMTRQPVREQADLILYNTCCVRENAENKALGNVIWLKELKKDKPDLLICVGGCMTQEKGMAEAMKRNYPFIDLVYGTHNLYRLPEYLHRVLRDRAPVVEVVQTDGEIVEGLPEARQSRFSAFVNIMYGCNNFCTYCVVPYVRGRERSRRPEDIVAEARELVASGVKDITLLGQNVNSYGRDLGTGVDFADLIAMINDIPGDFLIRFMTSHPKDATEKLFKTMAQCSKCAHQLHLPVQSGNDRVLKAMNRNYTAEKYLAQVELARSYMPDLVLTTDIIVGFPGETDEEFEDTIRLCDKVRYDAMFTFIYSKRVGTPAASMPDAATREDKQRRFDRLLDAANRVSAEKHAEYIGKTVRVLVDGETGKDEYNLSSRTNGGRLVHLAGDPALIGTFTDVKITSGNTWALYGKVEE